MEGHRQGTIIKKTPNTNQAGRLSLWDENTIHTGRNNKLGDRQTDTRRSNKNKNRKLNYGKDAAACLVVQVYASHIFGSQRQPPVSGKDNLWAMFEKPRRPFKNTEEFHFTCGRVTPRWRHWWMLLREMRRVGRLRALDTLDVAENGPQGRLQCARLSELAWREEFFSPY